MSEQAAFSRVFEEIVSSDGPRPATVRAAFDAILAGAWTPVQVAGFVVALRVRGETPEVIAAAAEALRSAMIPVVHGLPLAIDTCGTGGDGRGTLNVSTASALLVAAAGVPVAKHGNRAVSSRAGSADVLEALDVPLDVPPERQAGVLREAGIAFLFAPAHHPALRHGGAARRELGVRTVFNALGPLANPARASHQLLGAYDDALRPVLATTLAALGTTRAWIVRGEDGLDEVSPSAPTRVSELDGGRVIERVVTPEDFGIERIDPRAIAGGDARDNARAIEALLAGEAHPARAAIVLNAAAALVVAERLDPREATRRAEDALASGGAARVLSRWRELARAARGAG